MKRMIMELNLLQIWKSWLFNRWVSKEPELTLCHMLDSKAELIPEHVPLVIDGQAEFTLRDWVKQSNRLANALGKMGVRKRDRIALYFDGLDWLDYAVSYVAALRCGGTVIHLNGHLPESEILRRLSECRVTWIIRSPFISAPKDFSGRVVTLDQLHLNNEEPVIPKISKRSIAEIRYTSGTTGAAKGYSVPHANLTFGRTLETMKELSGSAAMLVPMTLGNSTSATILTIAITSQSKMILCAPVDMERMGELIENQTIFSLMLTPYIATQIVAAQLDKRYDLSSIKILASASSPLAPSLVEELAKIFPNAKMQIACAQSEASPALLVHSYNSKYPFSVGRPSSITQIQIVDDNERPVEDGDVGELWLKTPAPKRLFLKAPQVNARLIKDGWYRTNDLVRRNSQGEVEFFDRKGDALRKEGSLLSSLMIEARILTHPMIREAAVVGMPCKKNNHFTVAYVVLKPEYSLTRVKKDLRRQLSGVQFPDKFIAISTLPRTDNGKVLKRHLRLKLGGAFWLFHPCESAPRKGLSRVG